MHQVKRLIYCSVGANSANFTEVSVVILFHSSGPKAVELNFVRDLDQRVRLLKKLFLS